MEYIALKEICTINMGQSPESSSYNESKYGLPFFQGKADFGEKYPLARMWCSNPIKVANAGDILISVRAPIGALNYAKEDCCIGRGLAAIKVDESRISKEFIYYLLKNKNAELNSMGTGSTFKAIGRKVLEEILVPDIMVEIQKKYAQNLGILYDIIQKRKQQLDFLNDLIKAQFVEMFGDPETNSNNYRKLSWQDVFLTTTGKLDANAMVEGGKYPFFTCAKEHFWIDQYAFDCEALMLAGNNAAGIYDVKYYKGKFNAYQRTYVLQLRDESWSYLLFRQQLQDKLLYLQGQSKGTNTRYLTLGILKQLHFIVPPIELQNKFASFVQQVDKSKVAIQKSLDEMQLLFDSLMQKYFG